jgi:hypothetical protein
MDDDDVEDGVSLLAVVARACRYSLFKAASIGKKYDSVH